MFLRGLRALDAAPGGGSVWRLRRNCSYQQGQLGLAFSTRFRLPAVRQALDIGFAFDRVGAQPRKACYAWRHGSQNDRLGTRLSVGQVGRGIDDHGNRWIASARSIRHASDRRSGFKAPAYDPHQGRAVGGQERRPALKARSAPPTRSPMPSKSCALQRARKPGTACTL